MDKISKIKKTSLFIIVLIFTLFCFSCKKNTKSTTSINNANSGNALKTVKIGSMAPSITSIICELGFGDFIFAADSWSKDCESLNPNCVFFDILTPDVEILSSLELDIVFVSSMTKQGTSKDPFAFLSTTNCKVYYLETSESINEIKNDILFIAEKLKAGDAGENLVSEMEKSIQNYKSLALEKSNGKVKTVYFEISPSPFLYSFGSGVYLNELLEIANLKNIFSDKSGWLAVNAEPIIDANPDIIFTNVNFIDNAIEEIANRPGWETVKAVNSKNIFYIDNDASSQPSHEIVKALDEIIKAVY